MQLTAFEKNWNYLGFSKSPLIFGVILSFDGIFTRYTIVGIFHDCYGENHDVYGVLWESKKKRTKFCSDFYSFPWIEPYGRCFFFLLLSFWTMYIYVSGAVTESLIDENKSKYALLHRISYVYATIPKHETTYYYT